MVVRKVNLRELQVIIAQSPIPVLLEVSYNHPALKEIKEHFNELSRIYNGKIVFLRMDAKENPEILNILRIRPPTYVAFDRGGVLDVWYNPTPYQLTMIAKRLSRIV